MHDQSLPANRDLLDYLDQPILYVRDGIILYRNRAATQLSALDSACILDYLSNDDNILYSQYQGDGTLELTLFFAGRPHCATVHREQDADVFVGSATALYESLSVDTLSVIAQTLRAPLTDLFDVACLLFPMLEEQEDPKIQKQTARLNKSFYQLLRLSANLSDATRFITNEQKLYLERTDLSEFFYSLFEITEPFCQVLGIDVSFDCPTQPFYGSIDRQKVERAVLNLISNALKFTPKGGTIEFKVEHVGSRVFIRIVDDGEGIPPAILSSMFERYQSQAHMGDPRWGVGFGLPLVRYVATLHGGTVMLHSAPDGGTTATMSLSLKSQPQVGRLESPVVDFDYAGGYSHPALELADILPSEVFDSVNVN